MPITNISRITYETAEEKAYLQSISPLSNILNLIEPSIERILTPKGREFVETTFGSTFDLEHIVGIVNHFRLRNPDMSEMDAFIYECGDVIYQLTDDAKRAEVETHSEARSIPPPSAYTLASIYVLNEATKKGSLTINPTNCPKDEKCYVQVNLNKRIIT